MKKLLSGLFAPLLLAGLLCGDVAQAQTVNAQTGTTYAFKNSDCGQIVTFSNASAITATIAQASSASGGGAGGTSFLPPCAIKIIDIGTGTVTITPTTSTIGGNATLVLSSGQSATIVSDGANYQADVGSAGNVASNWVANGAVSVSLATSSIGPTGAHATVQEWMSFKDATGVTRYIPAF